MTMVQAGFPSEGLRDEHTLGLPNAFDRLERAACNRWSRTRVLAGLGLLGAGQGEPPSMLLK